MKFYRLMVFQGDGEVFGKDIVMQEKIFDDMPFISQAEDKVLMPPVAVMPHNVPKNRFVPQLDHGLGDILGHIADPRASSATENYRLHHAIPSIPFNIVICARSIAI